MGPPAAQSKGTCDDLENEGTKAFASQLCSGEGGEGGGVAPHSAVIYLSRGEGKPRGCSDDITTDFCVNTLYPRVVPRTFGQFE